MQETAYPIQSHYLFTGYQDIKIRKDGTKHCVIFFNAY